MPIVLLAWTIDTERGDAVACAMAERPALLRGVRIADALALTALAVVLVPASALAAAGPTTISTTARDPSAYGGDLVYEAGGNGYLRRDGRTRRLPGREPAVGDGRIAWRNGNAVTIADRGSLATRIRLLLPGAGKLAVSQQWLAYRVGSGAGDRIYARRLSAAPGSSSRLVAAAKAPSQLGRPSLSGGRLAYHLAGTKRSQIRIVDLASGRSRVVARGGARGQVINPALGTESLLYERLTYCRQTLVLRRGGRERVLATLGQLATRDEGFGKGHTTQGSEPSHCHPERKPTATQLWTTALTSRWAYLTLARGSATRLLRLAR